jgi:hypothetical protein
LKDGSALFPHIRTGHTHRRAGALRWSTSVQTETSSIVNEAAHRADAVAEDEREGEQRSREARPRALQTVCIEDRNYDEEQYHTESCVDSAFHLGDDRLVINERARKGAPVVVHVLDALHDLVQRRLTVTVAVEQLPDRIGVPEASVTSGARDTLLCEAEVIGIGAKVPKEVVAELPGANLVRELGLHMAHIV